jgi:hypothetical protein
MAANTGPYRENTEISSSLKLFALIEPKLCINHWKVLYKLCVFYVDRNSKMTTTAGHSFYIGPIGFFYNQVNDTGSSEPLVICFLDSIYISTNIENYKNRCINKSPIGNPL